MIELRFETSAELVDAVHAGLRDRLAGRAGRVEIEAFLLISEVYAWWRDGECFGAIFGQAPEMHAVFRPEMHGRWFGRRSFGAFCLAYFNRHDLMQVREWIPEGERLMRFIGAVPRDGVYEYRRADYELARKLRRLA